MFIYVYIYIGMMEYITNNTTNTSAPAARTQSAPVPTPTRAPAPSTPARTNYSGSEGGSSQPGSYSKRDLTVYLEGMYIYIHLQFIILLSVLCYIVYVHIYNL